MSGFNTYTRTLETYEQLTPEREVELMNLIKNGDENARDEFIKCNLKLVIKIAHEFLGMGLPIEDLVSVGNVGLMKAVDKYEFGKGTKFSSYAILWIKQSMRRELCSSSRVVSICCNTLDKMKKVKELKEQNKSSKEIADTLNTRNEKYIANLSNGYSEVSLNKVIDEDGREFGDFLANETVDTFKEIETNDLISVMMKHIATLNKREQIVLRYRYGLCGSPIFTQKELAKKMNYTYQRIQSIEKEAIAKLHKLMKDEK